jgi:competence protein ComEC
MAPPWPVPLALGVALGAAVTTSPTATPGHLVVALGLAGMAVSVAAVALVRPATRGAVLSLAVATLLAGVGVAAGALRGGAWAARPDPWQGALGELVELAGRSDGSVLWTARGGLVLRGAPVGAGRVVVRGRLEALPGRRNPGGIDLRAHWRRRGARAALRIEAVLEAPRRIGAREALARGVSAGLSPAAAGLLQAMTLGLRDDLGDLREVFAASGLAHVLALSGLHVGVLAAALATVARPLRGAGPAVVVAGVVAYVAVVGTSPSVARAAIVVCVVALATAVRAGRPAPLAALALALTLSLLAAPAWVGDLGFQLSYGSVTGIVVLAPPLLALVPTPRGRGRRALRLAIAGGASVSLAAQAATASLVASHFGGLPLLSPLVNLVAVPLASLLVPVGFLAGLAGLVGEAPARAVNLVSGPLAEGLIALARFAARAPSLPWGEVGVSGHVAFATAILASALGLARRLRPWRAASVVLVAAAVSAATPPPFGTPELVVLDVGQGDAIVLRLERGQAVLVDGGGTPWGDRDIGKRVVVPALRALGVRALSVVVASHADLDHVEGLTAVLGSLPVGELWIGHREDGRAVFDDLMRAAALHGVTVREVRRGESAELGRVRLDVVHPTERASGVANDDSVVVVVRVDGAPWALLAGDVSAAVEGDLPVPTLPVLVTPHHGSATSTSERLLLATRARLALVSVGRNRFGHPAPSVLERLARHGVAVRTTLGEGALRVPYPPP